MSLPRYPAYRDSGVEWLGKVPQHWPTMRLRRCIALNPSKSEVAHLPRDLEVSFLPMEAVGEDGQLDLSRTRPIGAVETGYTYFSDGDVAFAKITPCFENGKGALMRGLTEGIGFGTTELIVMRANPSHLLPAYLSWLVRSPEFRDQGEASMYGAGGQKRVPDDFVRELPWAMPTINEQQAIAIFLDRETAKIDALIAEQEKLIALLAEKRQATISHAITRGLNPNAPMKDSGVPWLGEVPAHWELRRIATISTKITNGYVGPTRDILTDSGVRYLQSLHIKGNQIRFDTPYFVSPEWSEAHGKSILVPGDVLIVQTGDIGQVACVTEEFAGCNCHALIIVSPIQDVVLGAWCSLVLSSNYGRGSLLSIQTGALHPHLNCGNVRDLVMPVPPMNEQRSLIEAISGKVRNFDGLTVEAQRGVDLLRERRSALIAAAVTGQIDVRGAVAA